MFNKDKIKYSSILRARYRVKEMREFDVEEHKRQDS